MREPKRYRCQDVGQGSSGAGPSELGLELILTDRDQLDADVGLLFEPVDDRLGGLDPVRVVLGGPERKAVPAVLLAAPAAADGDDQDHSEQGNDERPCFHGGSSVARHALTHHQRNDEDDT
jgi:hypothetical protein